MNKPLRVNVAQAETPGPPKKISSLAFFHFIIIAMLKHEKILHATEWVREKVFPTFPPLQIYFYTGKSNFSHLSIHSCRSCVGDCRSSSIAWELFLNEEKIPTNNGWCDPRVFFWINDLFAFGFHDPISTVWHSHAARPFQFRVNRVTSQKSTKRFTIKYVLCNHIHNMHEHHRWWVVSFESNSTIERCVMPNERRSSRILLFLLAYAFCWGIPSRKIFRLHVWS